jgi:hypothetical protein
MHPGASYLAGAQILPKQQPHALARARLDPLGRKPRDATWEVNPPSSKYAWMESFLDSIRKNAISPKP